MGSGPSKEPEYPILVAVVGATFSEGAAVVKALRGDARFTVRAVTDDINTDKAKAMIESGVEMVEADFMKRASLKCAIDGAYGVFATTDFWAHCDEERESSQGLAIADACRDCKVSHLVWSGMEDNEAVIFNTKYMTGYFMGIMGLHVTVVIWSYHYENLLGLMKPKKVDDTYVLGLPMQGKLLPMVSVEDSGECIRQIFLNKKKYAKKKVGLVGHWATVDGFAKMMTDNLDGMTFTATKMKAKEFSKLDMPEAPFLGPMFRTFQRGYFPRRCVKTARKLHPAVMDFPTWVRSKKDEFTALDTVVDPTTE